MRLSNAGPGFDALQGQYNTRAALLHVNCFYDGNCEPEQEMTSLIRATITYVQDAESLVAYNLVHWSLSGSVN